MRTKKVCLLRLKKKKKQEAIIRRRRDYKTRSKQTVCSVKAKQRVKFAILNFNQTDTSTFSLPVMNCYL